MAKKKEKKKAEVIVGEAAAKEMVESVKMTTETITTDKETQIEGEAPVVDRLEDVVEALTKELDEVKKDKETQRREFSEFVEESNATHEALVKKHTEEVQEFKAQLEVATEKNNESRKTLFKNDTKIKSLINKVNFLNNKVNELVAANKNLENSLDALMLSEESIRMVADDAQCDVRNLTDKIEAIYNRGFFDRLFNEKV